MGIEWLSWRFLAPRRRSASYCWKRTRIPTSQTVMRRRPSFSRLPGPGIGCEMCEGQSFQDSWQLVRNSSDSVLRHVQRNALRRSYQKLQVFTGTFLEANWTLALSLWHWHSSGSQTSADLFVNRVCCQTTLHKWFSSSRLSSLNSCFEGKFVWRRWLRYGSAGCVCLSCRRLQLPFAIWYPMLRRIVAVTFVWWKAAQLQCWCQCHEQQRQG